MSCWKHFLITIRQVCMNTDLSVAKWLPFPSCYISALLRLPYWAVDGPKDFSSRTNPTFNKFH
jgi:hypothetical protein